MRRRETSLLGKTADDRIASRSLRARKSHMKNFLICVLSLASVASATNLTTFMTVDNSFEMYISTLDNLQGTFVGSGVNWQTTYNFLTALTPAVTNFIHVVAHDG